LLPFFLFVLRDQCCFCLGHEIRLPFMSYPSFFFFARPPSSPPITSSLTRSCRSLFLIPSFLPPIFGRQHSFCSHLIFFFSFFPICFRIPTRDFIQVGPPLFPLTSLSLRFPCPVVFPPHFSIEHLAPTQFRFSKRSQQAFLFFSVFFFAGFGSFFFSFFFVPHASKGPPFCQTHTPMPAAQPCPVSPSPIPLEGEYVPPPNFPPPTVPTIRTLFSPPCFSSGCVGSPCSWPRVSFYFPPFTFFSPDAFHHAPTHPPCLSSAVPAPPQPPPWLNLKPFFSTTFFPRFFFSSRNRSTLLFFFLD